MEDIKPRYLVMVTASANNNKYYKQIPRGDSWTAEYGRIGAAPQRREYPMSQWESKYREKIHKGYVDQSELAADLMEEQKPQADDSSYKPIEDPVIQEIVDRLQHMAKTTIAKNYTISSKKVTQAMVDEAQHILEELLKIQTIEEFNSTLLHLFTVIPRKMSTVSEYLASSTDDFSKIIEMIENRRANAYRKVNEELIELYWDIGRFVSEQIQNNNGEVKWLIV